MESESKKHEWRKSASATVFMFGISMATVRENAEDESITSLAVETGSTRVHLTAFDDGMAHEMVRQLRDACNEWEQLLDGRAVARLEEQEAETTNV